MGRARGDAQDGRNLVLFAELEGGEGHVVGFLGVGGLQEEAAGELGEGAVVLLVLRGVHARVVRRDDDEAADGADVREGHQRIHRHVEADVLHRGEGADAREGGADDDFHGDLFVDGPFAVDFALVAADVLHDLGGGGAGVGGGDGAAGAPSGAGDGFVGGK